MKPEKLTIHELFQRERRYVVPLYQRPYVWGLEEQWAPLWEDIETQAEGALLAGDAPTKRSHFLGAVVVNVSKIVGASVARSEVIDGQQRLTTLQVFLAALRDHARAIESEYAARLRRLTEHEDEKAGSEAAFKVWPTNADRELFRTVMIAGSPQALISKLGVDRATAPRIAAAYLFFWERTDEFLRAGGAGKEAVEARVKALWQALRTALQLVVIELEDEDDPQVIFETLNARGQPLLPSDLIRNYVFLQAANEIGADADDLYERYWKAFDDHRVPTAVNGEDRFWHIEERQGRLTRPRIDLFLFHYLVMKSERDQNIGHLFREFRDWRIDEPGKIEALLADLQAHSEVFRRLISPTGNDRAAVLASRLKSLDNSTIYPLLIYLFSLSSERLPLAARDQIIEDLESWLVRRFVCVLTNKNYNRFFVSLLAKVKRAPADADLAAIVRAELARSSDPTTAWPSDEDFRAAWLSKPLYAKSRPDRSAMVLRAVELRTRTRRNEAVSLPDILTVEHLLPQKGTLADYPYAVSMPRREGESDDLCRDRLVHTVGNLTLLTGELNASASNGPFPEKVVKIVEDSDLRLNAWLRLDPPSSWCETDIVARGEGLFESAVEIWPRPAIGPENLDDDDPSPTKGVWRFTDPQAMQAKREQLLRALGFREGVSFSQDSLAKHRDATGKLRSVVAVSKRYEDRGTFPYWYAHNPDRHSFLEGGQQGYLLLGCMDRQEGFAIPRDVIAECLPALNSTTRKDGKMHWHLHLVERAGGLALLLPKKEDVLDVTPYRLVLEDASSSITTAATPA